MKYDVIKREGKHPKDYFYEEKYRGMKTIEFMGKGAEGQSEAGTAHAQRHRLIPERLLEKTG